MLISDRLNKKKKINAKGGISEGRCLSKSRDKQGPLIVDSFTHALPLATLFI